MTDISDPAKFDRPPVSRWSEVWRQFCAHKGAMVGATVFVFIVFGVYLGPLVYPHDPQFLPSGRDFITLRDTRPIYEALWDPSAKVNWLYVLGTDNLGRDNLARFLSGGRVSISVGLTAMVLSIVLGALIGLVAGFFKMFDGVLMRLTDLFLALPLLLMILLASVLFREKLALSLGPEMGTFLLIVGLIGLTSWMQTARIVRGDVLALKEQEFILAARSIGTTQRNLILNHILPNVMSPILASATLGIATAIITESALSFLGFGFPPDFPTWGKLLNDAVNRMTLYPERVIWPGTLISLTVLSVNYLGDGLRDALDPRTRNP